ncbi:protein FRIGIDA [Cinnamomum micranthum f. kanehirae]|uniref:FRIGIDA-like protein n=1 Tax=Cinnamomum micranthum f. kanehirae TaxID=337451 RepID=A0A443N775_9MAGN|nr:protein FRIGIDA [Cinnamomum micranthum f. kanehirae]
MENHLKNIQISILEKSKELDSMQPQMMKEDTPLQNQQEPQQPQKKDDPPLQNQQEPQQPQKKEDPPLENQREPQQPQKKEDPPHQNQEKPQQQPKEEDPSTVPQNLKLICSTMSSEGLRKYVAARMGSDMGLLRDEVSDALKLAPNPGRLVLDSIGQFYLQGGRAYASTDSPAFATLSLGIVVLEFFILSGCSKIEPSVQNQVKRAAVVWKSRFVQEGGICNASCEDALGLLLFVAAFGIPSEFGPRDVCELVRVSNLRGKPDALRRSPLFLGKFHDFIQGMVHMGLHVSAADLSCALGLEDKFPPKSLLSSFLVKANKTAKNMKKRDRETNGKLKEILELKLAALNSVLKCLEDNKLSYADIAFYDIKERIIELEKQLTDIVQKSIEEAIPKREEIQHAKRHQPTTERVVSQPSPSVPQKSNEEAVLKRKEIQHVLFEDETKAKRHQPTTERIVSQPPPSVPWKSNEEAVPKREEIQHGSFEYETKAKGHQPTTERVVSQLPPSVPQPQEQHSNGLPAKIIYNGGGPQTSRNGLPGAVQSNGQHGGLLLAGNALGAVAGNSSGPAAGPVPLMPKGSAPSTGSGMGHHWTGNNLDAVAGTIAGPAAGAVPLMPRGSAPSTGSGTGLHWTGNNQGAVAQTSAGPAAGAVPLMPRGSAPSTGSGMGLHWTGNNLGAVAGTSAGPAAGAVPLMPRGSAPSTGSGTGLHWTGNNLGAVAGTSAGPAAGVVPLMPRGSGPSTGSGTGLHWTGNNLGAVAGTSAGPAAGAVPLMPWGSGPSTGSGTGLHWTGNTFGAVARTSPGLAAGPEPVTPSHTGPSMGSSFDPSTGYGNWMPIGIGVAPLAHSRQDMLGFPPFAGQQLVGPPPSKLDSFPGRLDRGSGSSNLFQFVDTVLKGESSHHNSSHVGSTPPAATYSATHRTSFY